ncbi:DUF3089 domain-containing protein [Nonomuraea dietziae]|uniref:DUF3089 domain-containing protein n=1 Tax=Nonomuraea dietziae TaxID=65515 RepID=UPI0033C88026
MSRAVRALLSALVIAMAGAPPAAAGAPEESVGIAGPLAEPVWLCKPGKPNNLCGQDAAGLPQALPRYPSGATTPLDATRVGADGTLTHEPFEVAAPPPVDCFYAYPTVDLVSNPLLQIGSLPPLPRDEELAVTLVQIGRLATTCRLFVPVYRQVPLSALAVGIITGLPTDMRPGTLDVQQAWEHYWTHDNLDPVTGKRRGVVLLGHSQGTWQLATLLRDKIDGTPSQRNLVSAILLGGNIDVPVATDAYGGVPVCRRPSAADPVPTGCLVSFSAYNRPEGAPPNGAFGRTTTPGNEVVCVNPAQLLRGGEEPYLDAYLPTRKLLNGNALTPNGSLTLLLGSYRFSQHPTGYDRYTDTLRGRCARAVDEKGPVNWLQVSGGDHLFPSTAPDHVLGLHVADHSVVLGDVAALVAAQAAVWRP